MRNSALAATAHHEAGHAVAAIVRGIPVRHATIVAGEDNAGHVRLLARIPKTMKAMHIHGMVALAGEAAQRRFNPRSVRRHQGGSDREAVLGFALRASGSERQAQCLVSLWQAQADDLVQLRWAAIQHVAVALLERKTIDGTAVHQLIIDAR